MTVPPREALAGGAIWEDKRRKQMTTNSLAGARILVLGASAGIGRAFAIAAVKDGAQVVLAARRREQLDKTRAEAGGGVSVPVDLREPGGGTLVADAVREHLGGLDIIVSTVGSAPLRMMADTSHEDWQHVFGTNVIGIHRVVNACLPLLEREGMVMTFSSEAVGEQRTGLGAYAASKAALEQVVNTWRAEHPWLRFSIVTVGATFPTDFGLAFDMDLLTRLMSDWAVRGISHEEYMTPESVATVLLGTVAAAWRVPGVCVEQLTLRSPSPVSATPPPGLTAPETRTAP
jgi:NAD(P)-dependent dehydrogenase (short-subunit alcohol dehydrogenase family)